MASITTTISVKDQATDKIKQIHQSLSEYQKQHGILAQKLSSDNKEISASEAKLQQDLNSITAQKKARLQEYADDRRSMTASEIKNQKIKTVELNKILKDETKDLQEKTRAAQTLLEKDSSFIRAYYSTLESQRKKDLENLRQTNNSKKKLAQDDINLTKKRIEEQNEILSRRKQFESDFLNTAEQNKYNKSLERLNSLHSSGIITSREKSKALAIEKKRLGEASKSTENLANQTIRYLRWAGTIAGVLYAGKRAWDATLGTGIEVNKIIESNTMGIAALTSANTRMVDSLGNTLTPFEKFAMGQKVATKAVDDLRTASVKTYATFPQLLEIYQQAIGQTMSMGGAFGQTVDEVSANTIELSKTLSNIAGSIGMPMDRVREEIRSMLSGNASTDSLISTMLFGSPGEANKAIRDAKGRTNGVVDMLNDMMKDFKILETTRTYQKGLLTLQDSWSRVMSGMVEESGMFQDITDMFYNMSENMVKNTDDIIDTFDSLYNSAKLLEVPFDNIISVASLASKVIDELSESVKGLQTTVGEDESLGLFSSTMLGIAVVMDTVYVAISNAITVLSKFKSSGNILTNIYNATQIDLQAMSKEILGFEDLGDRYIKSYEKIANIQKEGNARTSGVSINRITSKIDTSDLNKADLKTIYDGLLVTYKDYENEKLSLAKWYREETYKIDPNLEYEALLKQKFASDKDYFEALEKLNAKTRINLAKQAGEKQKSLLLTLGVDTKQLEQFKKDTESGEDKLLKLQEKKLAATQAISKYEEKIRIETEAKTLDEESRKALADAIIQSKQAELTYTKQINDEVQKRADKEQARLDAEISQRNKILALTLDIENLNKVLMGDEVDKLSTMELEIAKLSEIYGVQKKGSKEQLEAEKNLLEMAVKYKEEIAKDEDKPLELDTTYYDIMSDSYSNMLDAQLELVNSTQDWQDGLTGVAGQISGLSKSFSKLATLNIQNEKAQDKATNDFTKNWIKLYKAKEDTTDLEKEHEKNIQKLRKQGEENQLQGYAGIAGAMSQMFEQGSRDAAAFQTIQSGLAIVSGVDAILNQAKGDPYTAVARMAAMAALVVSTLQSAGIAFGLQGKMNTSTDAFSAMEANTGTGSVLGDSTAQSESIANSLGILEDFAKPEFRLMSEMAKSLESIDAKMGGVSSLLLQQGGFAFGEGYEGFDTGSINNTAGLESLNQKIMTSTIDILTLGLDKLLLGGAISGLLGGITSSIMGGLFGKTSVSQTMTDSGIYFANTLLQNAIEEFNGSAYQTIQTIVKKKSWFSSSTSVSYRTYFAALDDEVERQFSLVLSGLYETTLMAGEALDKSALEIENDLSDFVVSIGKISLKGKTGDQIQETISAIFGKIADDMAKDVFPLLTSFQQVGEGFFETMTRVASGMEEAEYYIQRLGSAFEDISYTDIINTQGDVGFEALYQSIVKTDEALYGMDNNLVEIISTLNGTAAELFSTYVVLDELRYTLELLNLSVQGISFSSIRGAGSVDELVSGMESFTENFLTEAEKLNLSTSLMQKEFAKLNITMPESKDAFRDLVESIDLTTESGQEFYGRLIILSDSFSELTEEAEDFYSTSLDGIRSMSEAFSNMSDSITETIKKLLGNITGASAQDQMIQDFWSKRAEADVLLALDGDLTSAQQTELQGLIGDINQLSLSIQGANIGDNQQITNELVGQLNNLKAELDFDNQILNVNIVGIETSLGLVPANNVDMGVISSLPSFDVGTTNVSRDMIAQIHKNEMITPAPFAQGIRSGALTLGNNKDIITALNRLEVRLGKIEASTAKSANVLDEAQYEQRPILVKMEA